MRFPVSTADLMFPCGEVLPVLEEKGKFFRVHLENDVSMMTHEKASHFSLLGASGGYVYEGLLSRPSPPEEEREEERETRLLDGAGFFAAQSPHVQHHRGGWTGIWSGVSGSITSVDCRRQSKWPK